MFIIFVVSLAITLMRTSIFGEMELLIGNEKNVCGKLSRSYNGLWFCPRVKSELLNQLKRVRFAPETFRSPKSNDSPQKSINIGQFSIPIPQNQTQISSLCFGKNRATVHPCSSSILNFKPPAWILQRWSILPQSVATSLVLFLHFLVFQRFVNVAKSWAVQRVSALIFSSRLGFGGQKNC